MTVVDNILPVEPPCIKGVLPGLDIESVTLASHLTSLSLSCLIYEMEMLRVATS